MKKKLITCALMVPLISPRIYLLDRSFQTDIIPFLPIEIGKFGTQSHMYKFQCKLFFSASTSRFYRIIKT